MSEAKFNQIFKQFNQKYNLKGHGKLIGNLKNIDEITQDINQIGDEHLATKQVFKLILMRCLRIENNINNKDLKEEIFNVINEYETSYLKHLIQTLNKNDELNKHYQFSKKDINDLKKNLHIKYNNKVYSLTQAFFATSLGSGKVIGQIELRSSYKEKLMKKHNNSYSPNQKVSKSKTTNSELLNKYLSLVDNEYKVKVKYNLNIQGCYLTKNNKKILIRSLSNGNHFGIRHKYLQYLNQIDYFVFLDDKTYLALPSSLIKTVTEQSVHIKKSNYSLDGHFVANNKLSFNYIDDKFDATPYVNQFK